MMESLLRHYGKKKLRTDLWHKQNGLCCYCGKFVKKSEATLEHRVARSLGGTDDLDNLAMACQPCNSRKSGREDMHLSLENRNAIKRNRSRLGTPPQPARPKTND